VINHYYPYYDGHEWGDTPHFQAYGGWLQNPAPLNRWFIPLFIGLEISNVVQDIATIHSMKVSIVMGVPQNRWLVAGKPEK